MHTTAKLLSETGKVSVLRAGIWKPRTRPGSFQGIGSEALPWLVSAGKENGLPTTTEVANAQHVELALKAGIDILWVGARTTVNPFSVQEIADAIAGVDIPVMVKNPINPDLQLWLGAIERFSLKGIRRIVAIHRGFSGADTGKFRNAPLWEIPIALKAAMPNLPIICDPSHISGKRDAIASIAQKALDLGMQGLMVETHPDPENAWSDADQQMTPDSLAKLLAKLEVRSASCNDPGVFNELMQLRERIDEVDADLIKLLAQRMALVSDIGQYKKENGLTILQLERWKEIMESRSEQGKLYSLSNDFVLRYLELIHEASIRLQSRIMNESDEVPW